MTEVSKLSKTFQQEGKDKHFYDEAILNTIDEEVNLHTEVKKCKK